MRRALLALLPLVALLAAPPVHGGIPGTPIAAAPGAWVTDYATEVAAATVGGELAFVNGDLMRHNVVARVDFGADDRAWCASFPAGRCPLFWSEFAHLGETVRVQGLDQLAPLRTYRFYCTIHPNMEGTLVALTDTAL